MLLGPTTAALLADGAAREKHKYRAQEHQQTSRHRYPNACDFNAREVLGLIINSIADSLMLDISMRFKLG